MIAAVVPAAGRSARMGRPKLLLTFGGATLIHRVVTALRHGGVGRVIVVAPPSAAPEGPAIAVEAARAGAEVVSPAARPLEMRLSIELGLGALGDAPPPGHVLLGPADSPGITAAVVARLLDVAARRPDCIIVPCHDGRRGHPIILPWDVADEIRDLPPDVGVNALVARHRDRVLELAFPDPNLVVDLDTPQDWERWSRQLTRFHPEPEGPVRESPDQAPQLMDQIQVKVRLFALAKERAGRPELALELPAAPTVADLRAALRAHLPALGPLWMSALIAVDEEYAEDDVPITPGSQLAVIPPVSGGAGAGTGFGSHRDTSRESNQR
jgi:molybdenum cofactor cytidylyltransferase